jgi:hypothetical protein
MLSTFHATGVPIVIVVPADFQVDASTNWGEPDHPSRVINESGMNLTRRLGWMVRPISDRSVRFPDIAVQMP